MQLQIPAKKPRIRQKVQQPDQRTVTVCPIRAASDRRLTPMQLRTLLIVCSYTNKAGVTWAGLERIGKDLGISKPRAFVLVKALTAYGYIKTLHKGFRGVCADTRQVIFNPDIDADEAATITGELAPYQLEKQIKESTQMIDKQEKKQRKTKMQMRMIVSKNAVNATELRLGEGELGFESVHKQFATVDQSILSLALSNLPSSPTAAQIEAELDRLLR